MLSRKLLRQSNRFLIDNVIPAVSKTENIAHESDKWIFMSRGHWWGLTYSKWFTGLLSEHVMAVDWEKSQLQELDITATDLSTECLTDLLIRLPALRWLSAGQQDGFNDTVWMASLA